jgi:hypothetical protein
MLGTTNIRYSKGKANAGNMGKSLPHTLTMSTEMKAIRSGTSAEICSVRQSQTAGHCVLLVATQVSGE